MRDLLIQGEAELDDEENDESFDEDTGEVRSRKNHENGHIEDSSEEEEDDDDEEEARKVRISEVLAPLKWLTHVLRFEKASLSMKMRMRMRSHRKGTKSVGGKTGSGAGLRERRRRLSSTRKIWI
jgi:hypothetical protein